MSDAVDKEPLCPEVVDALLREEARIAGDLIEIVPHTWAIHGSILVDGDVILAEFERQETARAVLEQLRAIERRIGRGHEGSPFMTP
jgi:hypothetical protein